MSLKIIDADQMMALLKKHHFRGIKEMIAEAPEIVRCCDCKHFNLLPGYQYIDGFCGIGDLVTRGKRADGYCDRGERKDNDETQLL